MKLIVGLGNPGEKYKGSRHNVGYMLIDELQKRKLPGLMLRKTNVFMNDSGRSVRKILSKYKDTPLKNVYIAHDDLDIPLGEFKIQFGKGPKVHNGVTSVEEELGTKDFWRIRIGIENRNNESGIMNNERKISGEEYVLQDFTSGELDILNTVLEKCYDSLKMNGQRLMEK